VPPVMVKMSVRGWPMHKLPLFVNISKVEFSGQNKSTGGSNEEIALQ
jgi:hypothetical protein